MSRTAVTMWGEAMHERTEQVQQDDVLEDSGAIEEICGQMESFLAATAVTPEALWTAAMKGGMEEVKTLLGNGAEIQERGGKFKSSPLHISALHGHEHTSLLLIEKMADVSAKDKDGRKP